MTTLTRPSSTNQATAPRTIPRQVARSVPPSVSLNGLVERAETLLADVPVPRESSQGPTLTTRLRVGERLVETVSTIASFSGANEVALHDLRVELVFPADEDSARWFREAASSAPSA